MNDLTGCDTPSSSRFEAAVAFEPRLDQVSPSRPAATAWDRAGARERATVRSERGVECEVVR